MATVPTLEFRETWLDPVRFPSVETDEVRAREDMQYLFDVIKDYINEHIVPALPSGVTQDVLNMRGYRIAEVGTPTADTDATTKAYVDGLAKSTRVTANINTGWSGSAVPYTQVIPVAGVTANSIVEVSLRSNATVAQAEAYTALLLQDGGQSNGSITLRCFGKLNTVSIPINIVVRRD
jgi:hypothetical protein